MLNSAIHWINHHPATKHTVNPLLSLPSQISSLSLISPAFFRGRKLIRPLSFNPPLLPLIIFQMIDYINQSWLYELHLDWSRMVYSPTGSLDLFLIFGCMASNFLYLSFSTLFSSSLWRTDTIVFGELNKPPISIEPPIPPLKCVWNK